MVENWNLNVILTRFYIFSRNRWNNVAHAMPTLCCYIAFIKIAPRQKTCMHKGKGWGKLAAALMLRLESFNSEPALCFIEKSPQLHEGWSGREAGCRVLSELCPWDACPAKGSGNTQIKRNNRRRGNMYKMKKTNLQKLKQQREVWVECDLKDIIELRIIISLSLNPGKSPKLSFPILLRN